jgi:hypothetical protein
MLLALAVLAALVIAAEAVWLRPRHERTEQRTEDSHAVLALAQRFVLGLTNYSPDSLDSYQKNLESMLSTKAKAEFTRDFSYLSQVIAAQKKTSAGSVKSSGLADLDSDTAEVLVSADATASSGSNDLSDFFRFQINLVNVQGKWEVDSFTRIQAPTSGDSTGTTP